MGQVEVVVPAEAAGERLDRFLVAHVPLSRAQIQKAVLSGRVLVDSRVCERPGLSLRGGESLCIDLPPPQPINVIPEPLALRLLYEDEDLVVLDKPAGMVVHPSAGHFSRTLVNALLYHCPDLSGIGGALRPGIVHRLDKGTSGVMVVAKSDRGHRGLSELFARHDVERRYLALARGFPPKEAVYDTLYGQDPKDRRRFTTKVKRGKRAVTHIKTLERLYGASLVEAKLETGRTHQVRVHLCEHGFPLLGDMLYSQSPKDPILIDAERSLDRPALHAAHLGFVHPVTRVPLHFSSPPPQDFAAALDTLRRAA